MKLLAKILRLPLDVVYLHVDYFRLVVNYFRVKYNSQPRPCIFCYDPADLDAFPRPARAALKYGNLWVFRLVCPCVRPSSERCDVPHCSAESRRFVHRPRHAFAAVLLLALWGGVGAMATLSLADRFSPPVVVEGNGEGPGDWTPLRPADADKAPIHRQRGDEFFAARDYDSARIEYLNALHHAPEDVEIHMSLARTHVELGDWAAALESFATVTRLRPDHCDALFRVAQILHAGGRRGEAVDFAQRARDCDVDDVDTRLLLAELYFLGRQPERTAEEVAAAAERVGDSADHLASLARFHVLLGRFPEAEAAYRRAVELDPAHAPSVGGWAAAVRFQGRLAEARAILDAAGEKVSSNVVVQVQYAELAMASTNLAEAVQRYRDVVARDPSMYAAAGRLAELLILTGRVDEGQQAAKALADQASRDAIAAGNFVLARYYLASGQFTPAIDAARRILSVDPENLEARMLVARGLFRQRDFDNAITEFSDVVRTNPRYEEAHLAIARGHLALGNGDAAVTAYQRAAELFTNSTIPCVSLGNYFYRVGRIDDAREQYEETLRRDPSEMMAANNLAMILLDHRPDFVRAHTLAAALYARYPNSPVVVDTLGWALFKRGRADEALPLLAAAAGGLPTSAVVRYHYGAALQAQGRTDAARDELKAAIALDQPFTGADDARRRIAALAPRP